MIDNFIPEYEKTKFLRKVYYDDNDQEWHLKSESINQSMIMSEDEQSRPCTASSIYPDQQNGENCAKMFDSYFSISFKRNAIDELGLYMPESTTSNYIHHDHDDDESAEDDDNVQIEIL